MKKTYIKPASKAVKINATEMMATSPGGVSTNSLLGNEYNAEDESYTNTEKGWFDSENVWNKEW